jgi:hypothetical protein
MLIDVRAIAIPPLRYLSNRVFVRYNNAPGIGVNSVSITPSLILASIRSFDQSKPASTHLPRRHQA